MNTADLPVGNIPGGTRSRTASAWQLSGPGASLLLESIPTLNPHPGTVLVRMEAVPLLSFLGAYLAGKLPRWYPPGPFTPGTDGIGVVLAVGSDVYHLSPGQRVALIPHLVAVEITDEPAQILIGNTGMSLDCGTMLANWRNGTLAEEVLMPASNLAPLDGLESFSSDRLATMGKFIVPLGGLLRGRLAPGEILVVNGASGYYGSAAVLLGLALGAEQVIAAGRSKEELEGLCKTAGPRVTPVVFTGEIEPDVKALKQASGGRGAQMAFDMVGNATDPASTLASLRSLRRGGRLVLMGSMTVPLPLTYSEMLANDWEVMGNFMYKPGAYKTLVSLVRSGLLDLDTVQIRRFPFKELPAAIKQAAAMHGLDCTVVGMEN